MKFPAPISVPLKTALRWKADADWLYDVKQDGVRAELLDGALRGRALDYTAPSIPSRLDGCRMDGEWLPGARQFIAFDLTMVHGQNIARAPLWARRRALADLVSESACPWIRLIDSTRGSGGEFLETVLARGGEGIVAKRLDAEYGVHWFKAKRIETWDLVVVEIAGGRQSVRLAGSGGEDFGRCPVFGGKIESLRVGDVVEVAAYGRHASGKLREPRFVRLRRDKTIGAF